MSQSSIAAMVAPLNPLIFTGGSIALYSSGKIVNLLNNFAPRLLTCPTTAARLSVPLCI